MKLAAHRPAPHRMSWVLGALLGLVGVTALLISACSEAPRTSAQAAEGSLAATADLEGQTYVVGSTGSDEQRVLCEVTVAALESAGAGVTPRCDGGYDARAALVSGEINVYWEDTGTARATFMRGGEPAAPDKAFRDVARRDLAQNGIVWLDRASFTDGRSITVSGPEASRLRLRTVSDMAGYLRSGQPGTVCVDRAYATRPDGLAALTRTYGIALPPDRTQVLDEALVPQSTADGVCTFGEVSSTDGRVAGLGLTALVDDRKAHEAGTSAPTVRKDAFDRNPQIARVLDPISAALDQRTVVELNQRVASDGATPRDAAREWLAARGFIGRP